MNKIREDISKWPLKKRVDLMLLRPARNDLI